MGNKAMTFTVHQLHTLERALAIAVTETSKKIRDKDGKLLKDASSYAMEAGDYNGLRSKIKDFLGTPALSNGSR